MKNLKKHSKASFFRFSTFLDIFFLPGRMKRLCLCEERSFERWALRCRCKFVFVTQILSLRPVWPCLLLISESKIISEFIEKFNRLIFIKTDPTLASGLCEDYFVWICYFRTFFWILDVEWYFWLILKKWNYLSWGFRKTDRV